MNTLRGMLFHRARTAAVLSIAAGCIAVGSCSRVPGSITQVNTPAVSLPASLAFGSVPQGVTSPSMMVTLKNTGSASLSFSSNPSLSGTNAADFAITAATCSTANQVVAAGTCTVSLTFTPSTMAMESASLGFADNANPSTQTVPLTGTGTAPAPVVSLSTPSLAFGPVAQGTTSPAMTVTLTNTGNATLIFSNSVTITGPNAGDFSIVNVVQTTCGSAFQVAPNSTCTVQVTFTPSTSGMESATLNFADNATPAMQTVALSGGATSSTSNSVPLTVDSGPLGGDLNIPFISVKICAPGSNVNCQTIDHIEVDTGSSGLRIESSVLSISLPQATDSSGNSLGNCVQFADTTYAFGPIQTADIYLAGEKASSVPIQVIAAPNFPSAPSTCVVNNNPNNNLNTVAAFGANGLIGVGLFRQDCGQACVNSAIPGTYYICPNNICSTTALALAKQLQNPVWMFPLDNQGVLITLPAVGLSGSATVTGSLIFGIGTQANNVLGSASVLTTDAAGTITSTYNGTAYSGSFIDSGSNGFFFLDTPQTGLTDCAVATNPNNAAQFSGFYCPNSNASFPFAISNQGTNNLPAAVNFSIVNIAIYVNANPSFAAFSDAGGPFPNTVDFGLPFFYGRTVFTGIEGQSVGTFTGPFFAY
jgi:Protein of unknown function (DUF3443)/Cep192 domain 4